MKISLELQPILKSKSGIGFYTYELIKRLDKKNIDLQGCAFNFLNRNNINKELEEFKFKTEVCSLMPYGIYSRLGRYIPLKYNHFFKENVDLYHFFNFVVPLKIHGKVIVTIYDMVYKTFPDTMTRANYKRLDNDLMRSANRADKIITISENSKKEIIEYLKVPANKIEIVSPGVDFEVYNKEYSDLEKDNVKNQYNLPDSYILYLGTLEPRKNIEGIIEGYALYKEKYKDATKLVIAGNKGWMYEAIFEKVRKYHLEGEVVFTGYVKEEDKPMIYKLSSIFIFPSLYEGFGMPVLEAMAAGIPVITSNTSSLPEVCGHAAILVEPKDIEAMSEAMYRLQMDSIFREKLIQQGFKQCRKFNWNASVEKLVSIYEDVVKN